MPVKAAGWRMEPPVSVPVAPRQRPAATAAAEPPEEPPGHQASICFLASPGRDHRTEKRRLVRRAHGELIVVELAEHHCAVAPEVGADGRFIGRQKIVEDARARRGAHILGREHVLDAERKAFERTRVTGPKTSIRRRRHRARMLRRLQHKSVELSRLLHGRRGAHPRVRLKRIHVCEGGRAHPRASEM